MVWRVRGRPVLTGLLVALVGSGGLVATGAQRAEATPPTVTAISAGGAHTCALTSGGGVECWGWNQSGQVGDGTFENSLTPAWVSGLSSGVTAVSAGYQHTCALTDTGGVQCWGDNIDGQVGDGATVGGRTTDPVPVPELQSGVAAVSAGWDHTCALTSAGGVECWGNNSAGQLGNGTTGRGTGTPVGVTGLGSGVVAIGSGYSYSCALTSGGAVWCWGWNFSGQLGNGTTTESSTPVAVTGLQSGVAAISVGGHHTCALTSDGAMQCWGSNANGQLGNGTTSDSSTPVAVSGLDNGVAAISAGGGDSCALRTGGAAQCWGLNYFGELGNGTTSNSSTPAGVNGLNTGVMALSAGTEHTCALTGASGALCWGENSYGALGDGTTNNSSTPIGVHFGQTTTLLESSADPSTVTQPLTFTATVNPTDGGGTVAFSADGSTISGCGSQPLTLTFSGYQATCTTSSLLPGQHAIDASYTGDSLYDPSAAQTLEQNISVCHASADCIAPALGLPWQVLTPVQIVLDKLNPILRQLGL